MMDGGDLMKIFILISITSMLFFGCSKETEETTYHYSLPEELKDCKIFRLRGDNTSTLRVVKCPNSNTTTSYSEGKTKMDITVVEENLKQLKLKESALNKLTDEERKALGLFK